MNAARKLLVVRRTDSGRGEARGARCSVSVCCGVSDRVEAPRTLWHATVRGEVKMEAAMKRSHAMILGAGVGVALVAFLLWLGVRWW
jgi:hypothetical protein